MGMHGKCSIKGLLSNKLLVLNFYRSLKLKKIPMQYYSRLNEKRIFIQNVFSLTFQLFFQIEIFQHLVRLTEWPNGFVYRVSVKSGNSIDSTRAADPGDLNPVIFGDALFWDSACRGAGYHEEISIRENMIEMGCSPYACIPLIEGSDSYLQSLSQKHSA